MRGFLVPTGNLCDSCVCEGGRVHHTLNYCPQPMPLSTLTSEDGERWGRIARAVLHGGNPRLNRRARATRPQTRSHVTAIGERPTVAAGSQCAFCSFRANCLWKDL